MGVQARSAREKSESRYLELKMLAYLSRLGGMREPPCT